MNDTMKSAAKIVVNEYRLTCPELYPVNSDGYRDPGARQGHYILARSRHEALAVMKVRYPTLSRFTVRCFKRAVQSYTSIEVG